MNHLRGSDTHSAADHLIILGGTATSVCATRGTALLPVPFAAPGFSPAGADLKVGATFKSEQYPRGSGKLQTEMTYSTARIHAGEFKV